MDDVGSTLRAGRIALGLDITDVARKTCISFRYLKALEEGNFRCIPNVFDRGYLKIYANFLSLDAKSLLARFEEMKNRSLNPPMSM